MDSSEQYVQILTNQRSKLRVHPARLHLVCTFWWSGAQVPKPGQATSACIFQIFNIFK